MPLEKPLVRHFCHCDCRIQALAAICDDISTWTIGTVPNLDEWAQTCAGWLLELPTDDLLQVWMAMVILALADNVGFSVQGASDFLQHHVGAALLAKEASV